MNKLKQIVSIIAMALIMVLGIYGISTAATKITVNGKTYDMSDFSLGSTYSIKYEDMKLSPNMFCIQNGQTLKTGTYKKYTVVDIIDIDGKVATSQGANKTSGESIDNAKLAAGIYYGENGTDRTYVENKPSGAIDMVYWDEDNTKQAAIWYYMKPWFNSVGKDFGTIDEGVIGDGNIGLKEDIKQKVEAYANSSLGEDAYINDATNYGSITIEKYTYNNVSYNKVGPFVFNYNADIDSLSVKDQDRKDIENVLVMYKNGEDWKTVSSKDDSGKNFYVFIPSNSNVTAISSIYASVKKESELAKIKAKLIILKTDSAYQNLMMASAEAVDVKSSDDVNTNHTITLIGNLKVNKVDKKTQEPLAGVQFKVKSVTTEKYVEYDNKTKTAKIDVDENNATVFVTDDNGEIRIKNLPIGEYEVIEIYNPEPRYGIPSDRILTEKVDVVAAKYSKTQIYSQLAEETYHILLESDEGKAHNDRLSNEDFVKMLYRAILNRAEDQDGFEHWVEELKTKSRREIIERIVRSEESYNRDITMKDEVTEYFKNLYIYGLGRKEDKTNDSETWVRLYNTYDSSSLKIENDKIYGDLKVIKVDKDNNKIRLPNVGFKFKHESGKWVFRGNDGKISLVDEDKATTFKTDDNGEIKIEMMPYGKYFAYETSNPNYGYVFEENGKEIVIDDDEINEMLGNKQKYIKLSGYVWLDEIFGKTSTRNDLYKDNSNDSNDILVQGVTVRLKEGNTIIQETKTNGNGAYLFKDVEIEKLGNYYIEFEYNGLTYTNVVPHLDKNNGSKAIENTTTRANFNKKFSVIENNVAKNESGNKTYDLSYSFNNHISTLNGRDDINQFTTTANTNETGYSAKSVYDAEKTAGNTIEEIKYINLGLYEREQPDLAIVKDIDNVTISVNGYNHTYSYANRFENMGDYNNSGFNVGVKFGNQYGKMRYTRAIYKADYEWQSEDKSKELQVWITYKIGIRNLSSSLLTRVNSIKDYYDASYELDKVYELNNNQESELAKSNSRSYSNEYNEITINTSNSTIAAQNEKDIYVRLKLSREAVAKILRDKDVGGSADELLDNFAEINSYSTFDKSGNIYAGVDKNSNPGNMIPGNESTYEDDSDKAPALQLEVANSRVVTGKVFLDNTTGELKTGEERAGSGAYENGESGIAGVNVILEETSGTGLIYTAITDENGDYRIDGFIPGEYNVLYQWGGQQINGTAITVQNYKGTVYDEGRYNENTTSNKFWYKGTNKNNPDLRYTDAIDSWSTRNEIDEELKSVSYNSNSRITKTTMVSTTPTFIIPAEYNDTDLITSSNGDKFEYTIRNIDFGIVERARQEINVEKRVSKVKLTLANGEVVSNATIDENGKLSGETSHVTRMGPVGNNPGFVKLELDNDLIQGSRLEAEYAIKVTNTSEVDYVTERYYKFGTDKTNIVKIAPSRIVDYLDSDWAFENNNNEGWQALTFEEFESIDTIFKDSNETVDSRIILSTTQLKDKSMAPKESNTITLNVSKTLSLTENIELDNEVEVTELEKNGGSKIFKLTPGNYVPGNGPYEQDDDIAETVTVTPSTGANLDYTLQITIGLISLAILGVGVILIKKKVIDNK